MGSEKKKKKTSHTRGQPFPSKYLEECKEHTSQYNKDKHKKTIIKKDPQKSTALKWSVKHTGRNKLFNCTKVILNSDVDQDT